MEPSVSSSNDVLEQLQEADFHRAGNRFDVWTMLLEMITLSRVAEVGVWKGEYARFLLDAYPEIETYYMIDPWATRENWRKPFNVGQSEFDRVYQEALASTDSWADKREILRGETLAMASAIPDESLDFVYIDGDHTLRGISHDLHKMYPKVREGAFLGGDDLNYDQWHHGLKYEPTLVFPYAIHFAELVGAPVFCLPHHQFLIYKTRNSAFRLFDLTGAYTEAGVNAPEGVFRRELSRKFRQGFRFFKK